MGAKEIRDKLDAEIQELEKMAFGNTNNSPSEPAESGAADQTAQGSQEENGDKGPSAATETDLHTPTEKTFEAQDSTKIQKAEEQEEPTTKEQKTSYKYRWKKLKQYHDSEMYKARKLIGDLYDQLGVRDQKLQALQQQVQELQQNTPVSIKDFATQEEIDAIGEEELSTMHRLARQAVEKETADLKKKLQEAEDRERKAYQSASEDSKVQAYNIFLDRLGQLVPDFAEIDTDPRFESFLKQADPVSGFPRYDLFKRAEETGDVGRVAGFFNEFKTLVNKKPTQQKKLENKVTPVGNSATAVTNTTNTQGQPEIVPLAHYEQFMDDVTRGRFKGREAEAKEWEAYFDKAIAEGRLQ